MNELKRPSFINQLHSINYEEDHRLISLTFQAYLIHKKLYFADQNRPYPQLQWAELRVTTHEFCAERFPTAAGQWFFCAVNPRQTAARPGFGDVGAPLIWRSGEQDILVGLVAVGNPRNEERIGLSGYVNVVTHGPWIRSIVRV